jgi:hypothetical protein
MPRRTTVETRRDRRALAADAGFGSISLPSIFAGVLVAYGAFAILAALAAAIVNAIGVDTDVVSTDYEELSIAGGLITAGVLFLSYLFGGYVAGRMARRSGVVQGILVAVLGLIVVAVVAALVNQAAGTDDIVANLRDLGVPTTADAYGQAFTIAGLAALAGILLGGVLGGILGERWHGRLLNRAVDPNIGTEAEMRARAHQDMAKAEEERTRSFERARAASPERARRTDRDALSEEDRRHLDDDGVAVTGPATGPTVVDRSRTEAGEDRPSAWERERGTAAVPRPHNAPGADDDRTGRDASYWQRRS